MLKEPNLRRVYERIIEAVSADDAKALEGLIATDLVDHNPVPGQPPGREGFLVWMHGMHAAFPDMTGAIQDTVAEGDRIAARVLWTGTHEGEFLGLPGTGSAVSITAIHLVRFEDGVAAEWWGTADLLGAAADLGGHVEPSA
jgi:steroid delta-isomerase-like uncharacterized protein